jgi:hypothetical protein
MKKLDTGLLRKLQTVSINTMQEKYFTKVASLQERHRRL